MEGGFGIGCGVEGALVGAIERRRARVVRAGKPVGESKSVVGTDPRASTIDEFLRVLADTKPETFLLENVPGLGYRDKDEGLRLLPDRILAINKESQRDGNLEVNYSCHVAVLDAAEFGVPQRRERIFVVGHRDVTVVNHLR